MTRRTLAGSRHDPLAGGSIGAARRRLALEFRRGGLDAPELDARIIVGHALGLDHTALAAQSSRMLAADEWVMLRPGGRPCGPRHDGAPSAASNSAWCSVTSASMISPSASPSITCGSL